MAKLTAVNENREYFFELKTKEADRIIVNMYGSEYILIKIKDEWENAASNWNALAKGLIAAVIEATEQKQA